MLVNAVASQAARLRLTEARIAAINPNAVLCRIDAFGGPAPGPNSEFHGYDDAVQAATGIMSRFGGSLATPEEHAHVGTIDVLCGFAGLFACATALHARSQGRGTGTARTSLAAVGQLIQLPFMLDFPGKQHGLEPSGQSARGEHALYRAYRSADQWMFVAGPAEALPRVMQIVGAPGACGSMLERIFAEAPLDRWRCLLRPAGITVVPMRRLADLRASAIARQHDGEGLLPTAMFSRWPDHPAGTVELLDHCGIRIADEISETSPAVKYGADTIEILTGLGLSGADVRTLLESGIAATQWAADYLPD